MARALIVLVMLALFLLLLRRRLIHIDLSFPWFAALFVLSLAYNNPLIDNYLVKIIGVAYPIYAVIFLTMFILYGLATILLIMLTRDHQRQIHILRALARLDLAGQETRNARPA